MLTPKQRKYLEAFAHHMKPELFIGKNGLTPDVSASARDNIDKNELLKVKLQRSCTDDKDSIVHTLAERIGAEVVRILGNTVIMFKQKREKSAYTLPR